MSAGAIVCRAVIRQHSQSFSFAHKLLPAASRDAAAIVYAWCRRADDAVDERGPEQARPALEALERELDEIYAGVAQSDPVLEAFQRVVSEAKIPRRYPAELLAGMRMDVEGTRYGTLPELYLYCYRVAGTVGLMMCHVLGVTSPRALKHAAHLGIAMQLTNICRDVVEDWQRGRLYLPASLLMGVNASPAGDFPASHKDIFARASELLLVEADGFYASADRGLCYLSARSRLAVGAARSIYSRIGDVLRARSLDVTLGRARVPLGSKLWLLLRGLAGWLWQPRRGGRRSSIETLPVLRYPVDVLPR